MALLDTIIQMQSQKIPDNEIVKKLRDQGVSPQEINDSMNQARIKTAVSGNSLAQAPQFEEMEQSIMSPENIEAQMQKESPQQDYNYYPEANQPYSEQYSYPQSIDTSSISEIAEQVVSEKLNELAKKTGDLPAFRTETAEKIKDIDERLKKIENAIQTLQNAIIKKVGEFDETSSFIHKDLENIHDTMSKLMNPLIDNYRELKKISERR